MNTHLLIIDPQNDFCDPERGTLHVPGAEKDMEVLARWLGRSGGRVSAIHVTLDSHQTFHIAHPIFWRDAQGRHPAPFTRITCESVESGQWTTSDPQLAARGKAYVAALEQNGRYQLTIWPPHCRLGTWGHSIYPVLAEALLRWEEASLGRIHFVLKGNNPLTEHYSAVIADVPDPADPATQLNTSLLRRLKQADRILIAGEALSHCLANTVTDIADHFAPEEIPKLAVLRDATSCVTGCDALGVEFFDRMTRRGMRQITTQEA